MQDEMKSLYENNTFKLTKFPKGKRALKNKWVYKLKTEEYTPRPRKRPDWWIKVSVRERFGAKDVKTAFHSCDLDKKYRNKPEGFQVKGKENYRFGDDDFIILLLYVDDMLIVGKNIGRIAN
ncbi:hypothetical protein Tco_0809158 [Tanacetum coccineum]